MDFIIVVIIIPQVIFINLNKVDAGVLRKYYTDQGYYM